MNSMGMKIVSVRSSFVILVLILVYSVILLFSTLHNLGSVSWVVNSKEASQEEEVIANSRKETGE